MNESGGALMDLAIRLSETTAPTGDAFDCQIIPAEVAVLQVVVGILEEFPIYVSITDTQILFITYLWMEHEVAEGQRMAMLETMVDMNIPMPLSSFSRIGEHYVLFGATRRDASFDSVVAELTTLAENAVDALDAMQSFLT